MVGTQSLGEGEDSGQRETRPPLWAQWVSTQLSHPIRGQPGGQEMEWATHIMAAAPKH